MQEIYICWFQNADFGTNLYSCTMYQGWICLRYFPVDSYSCVGPWTLPNIWIHSAWQARSWQAYCLQQPPQHLLHQPRLKPEHRRLQLQQEHHHQLKPEHRHLLLHKEQQHQLVKAKHCLKPLLFHQRWLHPLQMQFHHLQVNLHLHLQWVA